MIEVRAINILDSYYSVAYYEYIISLTHSPLLVREAEGEVYYFNL